METDTARPWPKCTVPGCTHTGPPLTDDEVRAHQQYQQWVTPAGRAVCMCHDMPKDVGRFPCNGD